MTDDQELRERLTTLERKWQTRWEEAEIFQPDPNADEKFYITVAYPYPNGGMHIGHIRTYMLPDVFARYKRMRGKNVLFPMGWHVTGTPIIGALNRIKEGDQEQINLLKNVYNVPESALESFEEPMDLARYFIDNSYRNNMRKLGFSVDWRREFTTHDSHYNRFIEWQYLRLRKKGFVEKGLHPTKYDLTDQNPVTEHDLLRGEDAERQEFTIIKFEHDEYRIPTATLRPETIFGVTHLHVHPNVTYKITNVNGERWVISEEAKVKLEHQDNEVTVVGEVDGSDLVGEVARNPLTDETVPILPATFVDSDFGTGLVMSVPAHAPYDWISLQDLKSDPQRLTEYGIDPSTVESIEPKSIIDVDGYGEFPAADACEEHGVESQEDVQALETATDQVYQDELNDGTLNDACGDFASESVDSARKSVVAAYDDAPIFDSLYDFTEEVVSKSGGKVIVSLEESWFLTYDDDEWQELVREQIDQMQVIPEEKTKEYYDTVDWLENWPCIRNFGLGTKLPFDDEFIVEPLSDSTIYMAFYTISHIVEDVPAEKLEPEFFDYVFNGEGTVESVVDATDLSRDIVEEARESFEYWYPLDWRTTAYELIRNHLTFMLYHHSALFDQENWVNGIATWGMVLLESQKMSTSKGHVIVAEEAIERHSADIIRFHLFASNEPWQDFNWDTDEARDRWSQIRRFRDRTRELTDAGVERELTLPDRYVLSRLQGVIERTTEALEEFQTRTAILAAFFELNEVLNTYRDRVDELNSDVLDRFVRTQVKLMTPFIPHLCEELWEEMGHSGFISQSEWPEADPELRDEVVENQHDYLQRTVEDIRDLTSLVDGHDEITIVLSADWKRDLFEEMSSLVRERPSFGEAMETLVQGREEHAEEIQTYLEDALEEPDEFADRLLSPEDEQAVFDAYRSYLAEEFNANVRVVAEEEVDHERADRAKPTQPAIIME
jgi:leucyl-tRNA synthetase